MGPKVSTIGPVTQRKSPERRRRASAVDAPPVTSPPELTSTPASAAGGMGRWAIVLIAALLALAGVFFPRATERPLLRGPTGDVLADADSYMQWRLVHRALDAGAPQVRWIGDDDAPTGRLNEWTSPATIVGAAALRASAFASGRTIAAVDPFVRAWLGPAIALAATLALAALGRAAGGWTLAACWAIAWPASAVTIAMTRCGSVNRQATTLALFVLVVACAAAGRTRAARSSMEANAGARWGALLGVLCGVALWAAASELLPACACVAALALWESVRPAATDRGVARFWTAWLVAGLTTTAAALLFEFGPTSPSGGPGLFHSHLEFLSIWHVGLWLGVAGSVALGRASVMRRVPVSLARTALFLAPIVWAGATALLLRGFRVRELHVVQDPRFATLIGLVAEFQPYAARGPLATLGTLLTDFGLLPLLIPLLIGTRESRSVVVRWLSLVAALLAALTLYESRWAGECFTAVVLLSGYAIVARAATRPWIAIVASAVAVAPFFAWEFYVASNVRSLGGDATQGPYVTQMALQAVAKDLSSARDARDGGDGGARSDDRPVVLANWDWGGILAGTGDVRVVGSQYWSNLAGFDDTLELYTTTSAERFATLCRARQVDCLIAPDADTMTEAVYVAYVARHGVPPTDDQVATTAIWHVASDFQRPTIPTPRLKQLKPDWRVVALP